MNKFLTDLKAAISDFRTYVIAAIVAFLGWANMEANTRIDELQEQVSETVSEIQQ